MSKPWDMARVANLRSLRKPYKPVAPVGEQANNLLSSGASLKKLREVDVPVSRLGDMSCVCGMRVCGCHDFVTWSDGTKHRCVCADRGATPYVLDACCHAHEHSEHPERFPDKFCAQHKQWKSPDGCPQCVCVDCSHPVSGSGDKCQFCKLKHPSELGLMLDGLFHTYDQVDCVKSIYVRVGKAGLMQTAGGVRWVLYAHPDEMEGIKRRLGFPSTPAQANAEADKARAEGKYVPISNAQALETIDRHLTAPGYVSIADCALRTATGHALGNGNCSQCQAVQLTRANGSALVPSGLNSVSTAQAPETPIVPCSFCDTHGNADRPRSCGHDFSVRNGYRHDQPISELLPACYEKRAELAADMQPVSGSMAALLIEKDRISHQNHVDAHNAAAAAGNPMMKSMAGRMEVYDTLVKQIHESVAPRVPSCSPAPTYDNICSLMARIAEQCSRIPTEVRMSEAHANELKRCAGLPTAGAFTLGTMVGDLKVVVDESVNGWELR